MKLTLYATGALIVVTAGFASMSVASSRFGLTLSRAESAAPALQPIEMVEKAGIFREENSVFNKRPLRVRHGDPGATIADFYAPKGDKFRAYRRDVKQAQR